MAERSWFVIPVTSFGRNKDVPYPDADGALCCKRAVRIAEKIGDWRDPVWVVLVGDMPFRYPPPVGEQTLADLEERCVVNLDWEPLQIIKNPKGTNVRTVLLAASEAIVRKGHANARKRLVARWFQAPRVWLVALLVFRRPMHVSWARTMLPWRTLLLKELPTEVIKLIFEIPCTIASIRRERAQRVGPEALKLHTKKVRMTGR